MIFDRRDSIRFGITAPFLQPGMQGLEIGAGAYPAILPEGVRCERFDKRSGPELADYFKADVAESLPLSHIRERFPKGADFVIAHNVLEHCPNPIRTVMEWLSYARADGGLLIISLPHKQYCPGDSARPGATFEHILLDYLLDRDETDYESREHFIAGCVGWAPDWKENDKDRFAAGVLECAAKEQIEHHFHTFDDDLAEQTACAALWFLRSGEIAAFATPFREPKTAGEIIVVLRRGNGRAAAPAALLQFRERLECAMQKIQDGLFRRD